MRNIDNNIQRVRDAIHTARALRLSRQVYGVQGISNFVQHVDGDWLEDWKCITPLPL